MVKSMLGEPAGAGKSAYFSGRSGLRVGGVPSVDRRKQRLLFRGRSHARRARRSRIPCRDKGRIVIGAQVSSLSRNQSGLSVHRRSPIFHRVFFEHFEFPPAKKIWSFPTGFYPTEDSCYEKAGPFDDCNSGASKRRIDLFFCRRRSSDAPVLTRTLRREVSWTWLAKLRSKLLVGCLVCE